MNDLYVITIILTVYNIMFPFLGILDNCIIRIHELQCVLWCHSHPIWKQTSEMKALRRREERAYSELACLGPL